MKTIFYITGLIFAILPLASCDNHMSLQEYYVENSEKTDFITIDVPASIVDFSKVSLNPAQRAAYQSLRKLNILAFKRTDANGTAYQTEKNKVKAILSSPDYKELMTFNNGEQRGTIKYLGTDDSIDEVIIFGSDNQRGFALVRVLGNNMKPENMAALMAILPQARMEGDDFKALQGMFGR